MKNDLTDGFDPGDDEKVIEIFKKWKGGKLSDALFTTLAGIVPTPTIETVVLRKNGDKIEILLIPRPANDIVWKGKIHSPGGALRRADYFREDKDPLAGVFERIENQEIKANFDGRPEFVGVVNGLAERGPEVSQVYLAKLPDDYKLSEGSGWYDVSKLDQIPNFIESQKRAIEMAAGKFRSR